jgi:predicted DCC family thiol-disulfide oxidoreductase YuxK
MEKSKEQSIILFDGICNFCNGLVKFVLERDHKGVFLFASLQSEAARRLMKQFDLSSENFDPIILIREITYCMKSEAALKIDKGLGGI